MKEIDLIKKSIDAYASDNELSTKDVLLRIKQSYDFDRIAIYLDHYRRQTMKVTDICRELNMSTNNFYKILKRNNVKYNTYSHKNLPNFQDSL